MFNFLRIDSKIAKEIDFKAIATMIFIILYGIIDIYMASGSHYTERQLLWLVLSLVCLYILLCIDYDKLLNYVEIMYWASVILLFLTTFVIGTKIKGARGWIVFGPVSFQTSEFVKITIIFMLGKKLQEFENNINNFKNFVTLAIYVLIPAAILFKQPDMGMLMVFFFITLGICFCAGLKMKTIILGLFGIGLSIMGVWKSGLIKDYQKRRFISFLNPGADASGDGLQINRALNAIGSGGVLGKGLKTHQYADNFVPENHTDMIFSVLANHFGIIGCIILLILYCILIYHIIKIAREAKDIFGSVICAGIASYFIYAVLQNIGMNIAIMPITGITLPLMSYGGSSLLTTVLSIGLVINVGMRRKKIRF